MYSIGILSSFKLLKKNTLVSHIVKKMGLFWCIAQMVQGPGASFVVTFLLGESGGITEHDMKKLRHYMHVCLYVSVLMKPLAFNHLCVKLMTAMPKANSQKLHL